MYSVKGYNTPDGWVYQIVGESTGSSYNLIYMIKDKEFTYKFSCINFRGRKEFINTTIPLADAMWSVWRRMLSCALDRTIITNVEYKRLYDESESYICTLDRLSGLPHRNWVERE